MTVAEPKVLRNGLITMRSLDLVPEMATDMTDESESGDFPGLTSERAL